MPSPTNTTPLEDYAGDGTISTNWSKQSGSSSAARVGGLWTPTGYSEYWWNLASYTGSIEAFDTIAARPSANAANHETYLSIQSGWATSGPEARDGYQATLRATTTADQILVVRYVAGTPTTMLAASSLGTRMAAGDKWLLRKQAGGVVDVSVFQSGVWSSTIVSGTDGTPFFESTAANIGNGSYDAANSWRLDDFGGGLISALGSTLSRQGTGIIGP